jgi:hypothetical protein
MEPRLTRKQAAAFADRISRMLGFVGRCRRRLEKIGFSENGAILQAVDKTCCAMQRLHVELRYMSCESGVWRVREEPSDFTSPSDQAPIAQNRPDA